MNMLFHLLYTSCAVKSFSQKDLENLLDKARENNGALDVTGMLLYREGDFMQVLEGDDEDIVKGLYQKICSDPRHDQLELLFEGNTKKRLFAEWSMAFCNLDDPEAVKHPGYSEFLNLPITEEELGGPSRCERFLKFFKKNF